MGYIDQLARRIVNKTKKIVKSLQIDNAKQALFNDKIDGTTTLISDFVQYGKYSESYLNHQIGVYAIIGAKPYTGILNQYNRCAMLKVVEG